MSIKTKRSLRAYDNLVPKGCMANLVLKLHASTVPDGILTLILKQLGREKKDPCFR